MQIGSKEFYEIMENFERNFPSQDTTKEKDKELWKKGYYYCNGKTNDLFIGFQMGYSAGRAAYIN